ncbi:glycerate kinase, partial [Actinomadura adrarensis]
MAVSSPGSPLVPPQGGHVLLAPDRFKGSLTAPEVARHLASGLRRARPA